jgi:hypothetical protein
MPTIKPLDWQSWRYARDQMGKIWSNWSWGWELVRLHRQCRV